MEKALKKLGRFIFNKFLIKTKEYNKEKLKKMSCILCPNHTSDWDGPVIWSSFDNIRIMAKKECFKNPIVGKFLNNINIVSFDRQQHNATGIRQASNYLFSNSKIGDKFMLFPQGTISDINKNTVNRVQQGAFVIAFYSNTPIVPVFIEQPRVFKKSMIVYGEPLLIKEKDICKEDSKRIDRKKLKKLRLKWLKTVLFLQKEAEELSGKSIRKLKLSKKHANNNNG